MNMFNEFKVKDQKKLINMTIDNVSSSESRTPNGNSSSCMNIGFYGESFNRNLQSKYMKQTNSKKISLNLIDLKINNPLSS